MMKIRKILVTKQRAAIAPPISYIWVSHYPHSNSTKGVLRNKNVNISSTRGKMLIGVQTREIKVAHAN